MYLSLQFSSNSPSSLVALSVPSLPLACFNLTLEIFTDGDFTVSIDNFDKVDFDVNNMAALC